MRTLIAAAVLGALAPVATSAGGEGPWLPGGEETKKAVETRRGKTELGKLAAGMKPGTWATLKTEMPKGLWSSPVVPGPEGGKREWGGAHIAGWTDDAHWDSRTGQFLYMGFRETRRFVAYSEEKNAWREIELDRNSDNPSFITQYGHIYGNNALDADRSRFYHQSGAYQKATGGVAYFDLVAEKWTKLPPRPASNAQQAIEYFGAMDGLVHLGKQVLFFGNQQQKWETLGESPVDGYHSLFRHNPYRQEILMAGGNNQPQTVARLKKDGKIEKLKDFPSHLSVQSDKITIDPASGRYLILGGNKDEPKKLYEFDSDKNEYRLVEPFMAKWPYGGYAMPVCAFIPEHGVVMWAEPQGVFLYKHDPGAAGGGEKKETK